MYIQYVLYTNHDIFIFKYMVISLSLYLYVIHTTGIYDNAYVHRSYRPMIINMAFVICYMNIFITLYSTMYHMAYTHTDISYKCLVLKIDWY